MIALKDLRYHRPGDGWGFFNQRNSELIRALPPRQFSMVWSQVIEAAYGSLDWELWSVLQEGYDETR